MKRISAIVLVILLTFTFAGCEVKINSEDETPDSFVVEVTENNTEVPTEPVTQPPTEPEVKEKVLTLTDEEQYIINIFLSNFSEQHFPSYDSSNVSDDTLVQFAYLHNVINNNDALEIDHNTYDASFTLDTINTTLDRYLGKSISPEEGDTFATHYRYSSGRIYCPMASGASYGIMTVVDTLTDLGDGTLRADFVVYSIDELNTGGNKITDKSVYYYTKEDVENNAQFIYEYEGNAILKRKNYAGVNTYELITYSYR